MEGGTVRRNGPGDGTGRVAGGPGEKIRVVGMAFARAQSRGTSGRRKGRERASNSAT